eukprot:2908186-Amphidinium_carterae.1
MHAMKDNTKPGMQLSCHQKLTKKNCASLPVPDTQIAPNVSFPFQDTHAKPTMYKGVQHHCRHQLLSPRVDRMSVCLFQF